MGPFMSILQEHIGVMKKEELTSHQSQLTIFFLEALDFRAQHSENDLEEIGKTENCIIDCLVAMVVKLSEVTFRPLFFKVSFLLPHLLCTQIKWYKIYRRN